MKRGNHLIVTAFLKAGNNILWGENSNCNLLFRLRVAVLQYQFMIINNLNTFIGDELKQVFGQKVYKLSLDTGFTCPTRDGTKGSAGCFYCGSTGSHFAGLGSHMEEPINGVKSITDQIKNGKQFLKTRYNVSKFIAYFQAFTSTYGPLETLEAMLQTAVQDPEIVGINLATRPDCLGDEVFSVLSDYLLPSYHWLEIGLESSHDATLKLCGRGHNYADFLSGYKRAKQAGFRICVHVILGLPGETEAMITETIDRLIELNIDGIKFHNLHILKNSVFEKEYLKGNITIYTLNEYSELLAKLVKKLPKSIVIHRLMGDAPKSFLIAPDWVLDKQTALALINKKIYA
ncbi:TIGR01212 family radical SAM protein [Thermoproteota archaeon]